MPNEPSLTRGGGISRLNLSDRGLHVGGTLPRGSGNVTGGRAGLGGLDFGLIVLLIALVGHD